VITLAVMDLNINDTSRAGTPMSLVSLTAPTSLVCFYSSNSASILNPRQPLGYDSEGNG